MAQEDQLSVDVAVDGFPLILPERLGALRIVLLRQSNEEDAWDLDFATLGVETRNLWVKAQDDLGNEYAVATSWHSSDEHLAYGTYTFKPRLADAASLLTLTFCLEDSDSTTASEHEPLSPERLAGHWVEVFERQLAGWAQRNDAVEAVLGAANREEAIERLTRPPLRFSEAQATSILDLPLWRLTEDGERLLREDLESAREHSRD